MESFLYHKTMAEASFFLGAHFVVHFQFQFSSVAILYIYTKVASWKTFSVLLCEDCKFHNLCCGRGFCVSLPLVAKACMNDP